MIIRKPYAFLIKHFRMIHLILSVLLVFLATKTHAIFTFFNNYVKNGYYAFSNNLSSRYINFYMFIAIVLVIVVTSFVYLLMKWKQKKRVFYISICLFYFLLFIVYLVYFNVFQTILNSSLGVRAIRAYRDIIAIVYVPQYIFVAFSIVRAIGFDIKKFDFKKDLEELDIAEEDQEEIEVTFGQNSYKYKRKARRIFREIKYYALENKFFFGAICSTVLLVFIFFVYVNLSVFGKKFKESDFINIDGVIFRVEDSYVSNVDLRGNVIRDKYKYVIVKLSMDNTNTGRINLNTDELSLMLDDDYFYPVYTKVDYFRDFGEGYYKNTLYPGEKYEYLLIYQVPRSIKLDDAIFRLMDNVSLIRGEISAKYKDVKLNIENYMNKLDVETYNLGDAISLEKSTLLNSEFLIDSFDIKDQFVENYIYTVGGKTYNGQKYIMADTLGKDIRTMMKINMELDIVEDLYISKFLTTNSNFISTFGSIVYVINDVEKVANIKVKSYDNVNTKNVYIEVPNEIKNASSIKLKINVRNAEYVINLK